jgi:hypothetical protein
LHACTLALSSPQSSDIAAPNGYADLVKELKERDGILAGGVDGFSEL